jgi:hypothetical protein
MNLLNALAQGNVLQGIVAGTYTATETGTGVDMSAGEGVAVAILNCSDGTGTSPTLDVKLQSCATVGGTYADISGATFTQVIDSGGGVQVLPFVVGDAEAFVRAVGTITGTTPSFDVSVTLLYFKKAVSS